MNASNSNASCGGHVAMPQRIDAGLFVILHKMEKKLRRSENLLARNDVDITTHAMTTKGILRTRRILAVLVIVVAVGTVAAIVCLRIQDATANPVKVDDNLLEALKMKQ